jgi:pyrroline-5-carboxylate reductase
MAGGVHTVAVVGTGKMGETMLSGLLRAGWPAARLMATARRPERAEELRANYGIRVVSNREAVQQADVVVIPP